MSEWQPRKEFFEKNNTTDSELDNTIPSALTNWLSKLKLLYGVPFQYLIPDEKMLPLESIRFFYIDENWINNLVDGAFSIGRVISNDIKHDNMAITNIRVKINKEIPTIRQKLLNKDLGSTALNDSDLSGIRTGFLLRSAIVEGWPGIEVMAYSIQDKKKPLSILRMEHLSKDVLLCIFEGEFQKLELREPAETMHFGVDLGDGKFTKKLRGLGVNKVGLGIEIPDVFVDVPTKNTDSRTLDVLKTIENIKSELQAHGEFGKHLSSAEFAVEMVENAQMGEFLNE